MPKDKNEDVSALVQEAIGQLMWCLGRFDACIERLEAVAKQMSGQKEDEPDERT